MSEGKSQKQKEQWRSYVLAKLSEDVDDQENIRRIMEDNEGRDLGIKEYLERLKKLHEQAKQ